MLAIWQDSSIHGMRYIGDRKSNSIVRLFWLISISLSIIGLFYYGKEAFIKFSVKPDINLIIKLKPIRHIPFPAVTICSPEPAENIFTYKDNFVEELNFFLDYDEEDLSSLEFSYIAAAAQGCNSNAVSNLLQDRRELLKMIEKRNVTNNIVEILDEISFPTWKIFRGCESFHGYTYDCSRVMRRVLTNHGFCFTYNLLDYNSIFNTEVMTDEFDSYKQPVFARQIFRNSTNETQWTLEGGYIENASIPFRIINKHKFAVDMEFAFDAVYVCKSMNHNYKMMIHLPSEYPTEFHYYKFIESNTANRIIMTAEYYDSDSNMRKFKPDMRGCYFDGERILKFFKTYTKSLCNLECLTNYTLQTCGCVKFSMPREIDTPVCNLTEVVCYEEARNNWFDSNTDDRCNCLDPCTYIVYQLKDEDRMSDGAARLEMSFDEFQIKSHHNFVSYQLQSLIAEFGGLLGLFMGGSVLSIIELFYFCFASVVYFRRKKNERDIEKNDENILPAHLTKIYVSEMQPKRRGLSHFQREFNHKINYSYHM